MFLLLINTLLAQDAFKLSELKAEAKLVSDQREAIAREIDAISSPEALAKKAAELGMKPSKVPNFLDLNANPKKDVINNG
jgi:predicted DsbA family dithiol-disulfide isomerase